MQKSEKKIIQRNNRSLLSRFANQYETLVTQRLLSDGVILQTVSLYVYRCSVFMAKTHI